MPPVTEAMWLRVTQLRYKLTHQNKTYRNFLLAKQAYNSAEEVTVAYCVVKSPKF